jgi:hypothetical protein
VEQFAKVIDAPPKPMITLATQSVATLTVSQKVWNRAPKYAKAIEGNRRFMLWKFENDAVTRIVEVVIA